MNALSQASPSPAPPRRRPRGELAARHRAARDEQLCALMQAAQRGDLRAYGELAREVAALLQRLFRARFRRLQKADRDDVVQDVLMSLHRARGSYDPRQAFTPWLMAIARNRMIDRLRRSARIAANEILVDEFTAIDFAEGRAPAEPEYGDPQALRQAINRLPEGQRRAIELLKLRDLSLKEAASATGMTTAALRVSVHRAIKSLRASLH